MKDELGCKIMKKFVGLRPKTYNNLIGDGNEDKKANGTKKCIKKRKIKFENYKNCSEATHSENKINHLGKNETDRDILAKDHKEFMKKQQINIKNTVKI